MVCIDQLQWENIPCDVRDELGRIYRALTSYTGLRLMLRRLFSLGERTELIKSKACADQVLDLWGRRNGLEGVLSLLEAAKRCCMIDAAHIEWLCSELELRTPSTSSVTPSWNPRSGVLAFEGETIRNVKVCRSPTKGQRVLDAFDADGWPAEIAVPGVTDDRLHQARHRLQKKLSRIAFSVVDGGRRVSWTAQT